MKIKNKLVLNFFLLLLAGLTGFSALAEEISDVSDKTGGFIVTRAIPLNVTTIRWEFQSDFTAIDKYLLVDAMGNLMMDSGLKDSGSLKYFDEGGLLPNTTYWRMIKAVSKDYQVSLSPVVWGTTMMPSLSPLSLLSVGENKVAVGAEIEVDWDYWVYAKFKRMKDSKSTETNDVSVDENLNETAYFFENSTQLTASSWIKDYVYTFRSLTEDSDYELRLKSRNAEGIESESSPPITVRTLRDNEPLLQISLRSEVVVEENLSADVNPPTKDVVYFLARESVPSAVFFPGEWVKHSVYYRNVGMSDATETFLLIRWEKDFAGLVALNERIITPEIDHDRGDYDRTLRGSLVIRLETVKSGKGGVVEFWQKIDEKTSVPSVFFWDCFLGYKESLYGLVGETREWIGAVYPREEILGAVMPPEIPLDLHAKGGLRNEIYTKERVLRQNQALGGGRSRLAEIPFGNMEERIKYAIGAIKGEKSKVLNQTLFRGSVPLSVSERVKMVDDMKWLEDEDDLLEKNFQREMAEFLARGGAQDVLAPLELKGEVEAEKDGLVIKGTVGESQVAVELWVNDFLVGKTQSLAGGAWNFEVPYRAVFDPARGGFMVFTVEARAQRISRYGEKPHPSTARIKIGAVEVDFGEALMSVADNKSTVDSLSVPIETEKEKTIALNDVSTKNYDSMADVLFLVAKVWNGFWFSARDRYFLWIICLLMVWGGAIWGNLLFWRRKNFGRAILSVLWRKIKNFLQEERTVDYWGVVYDATRQEPVRMAVVCLYTFTPVSGNGVRELVGCTLTDKYGRYHLPVGKGDFILTADKFGYVFPSSLAPDLQKQIRSKREVAIYYGQKIVIRNEGFLPAVDIPVDRVSDKLWKRFQSGFSVVSVRVGFFFSLGACVIDFRWFYGLMVFLFGAVWLVERGNRDVRVSYWGNVFDSLTLQTVSAVKITVREIPYGREVKTILTDGMGRFGFDLPSGFYELSAEKDGYGFPSYRQGKFAHFPYPYLGGKFWIKKNKAPLRMNIPLDKKVSF